MKRTVFRMLDEAAKEWADDPYALRKTDEGYAPTTFAQAREKARRFGAWLLSCGYSKGDSLAVLGEGSPEWICGEFGIMCAGLVSVPLSIKLLAEEIPFRLNHSESKGILTTHNQLEKVLNALQTVDSATIKLIYLDDDVEWGRAQADKRGIAGDRFMGFAQAMEDGQRPSNPMEVAYAARRSGISTREVLCAMKDAGLGSMCGTAAEILVDSVRDKICAEKIPTDEWIRIIREAHGLGIKTTATIMYGHCETDADRGEHLNILRSIQDETHGFTEFVPLSFIHLNTPLFRYGLARAGATGREDLLMVATSRLFLDNFQNIQVSWVKEGIKLAQLGLIAGGNDLGGTMFEESISKGAGAVNTDYLDPKEMKRVVEDLGRCLRRRTTLYELL